MYLSHSDQHANLGRKRGWAPRLTKQRVLIGSIAILVAVTSASAETHELNLIPANVHWGYFDSRIKPVLRIDSGDTVHVETMLAGGFDRLKLARVPDAEIPQALKEVDKAVTD